MVISGSGFTGTISVAFGGTAAASYTVNSDTRITASTPAHAAGAVYVSVSNGNVMTNQGGYTFVAYQPPGVTTNPNNQTVTAGQTATFTAAASGSPTPTVQWQVSSDGGASFSNIAGATATSYTTPATVAADNGKLFRALFANSQGTATTTAATLTVVSPPAAGNQSVTTAYQTARTITLTATDSNTPARTLTYTVASTPQHGTLTGTAPNLTYTPTAGYSGADSFTFTASNGAATSNTATISIAVQRPLPTVASVSPTQGTTAGGTAITIFGAGFTGATGVTVGGTSVTSYTVNSDNQITASTPAGLAGRASVQVTNATGTNAQNGLFTYISPPTANSQSVTTQANTATTITLTGSNATGYTVASAPQHGSLTGTAPNLTYTPSMGYAGADSFRFYTSNAAGDSSPATVSITVAPPTITLAPTTLPAARVGTAYSQTLTAAGGTAPYTYAVTAGATPAGITLATNGTLSGSAAAAGSYTFTITARDNNGNIGAQSYTLTVAAPAIVVSPASLPGATAGVAYSQTITASGGTAPYTYAVTAGALPAGMTLATNGALSGTPTAGGTFDFTLTATDANGNAGARSYSLTVNAPTITVAPATLPGATAGVAYSQTLAASGGTAPYAFSVTAGALPAGLTLASSGTISGTPTASGTFNFTASARDSSTGSGPYGGSRSYSLTVGQATTATALTAAPNPSTSGQAVTLTATVTSASGTPTGTVTFTSNGATLGTANLANGVATLSTAALPVGTDTVTASYGGEASFSASSGSTTQTVNPGNTATALTAAPNPSTSGQAVTLTATVTSASGTPTGTVTFTSNGATLGTANLANGVATLSTAALPVGADTVTASYGGAASFAASSGSTTQTVNPGNTATALTAAPNPSTSGQAVTLTATVTSASGTPTGTVTFTSNGATLGTANLANGVAALSTAALPVGTDTVTASYGGAASFAASSGSTTQTVNPGNTATALTAAPNPSTSGQAVTLTATVTSASGTPTGTVTFISNGATLGTANLANGVAALSTAALPVGTDTVTASYGGAASFSASSGTTVQTVNSNGTTTTLAATPNPSAAGQAVTFTATVTGRSPTGTVTFSSGGTALGTAPLANGVATLRTVALAIGANAVTARYSGDSTNLSSVSATLVEQVNAAPTITRLSSSANPSLAGQPVRLTAAITSAVAGLAARPATASGSPGGTVTFRNGGAVLGTATLAGGKATLVTSALANGSNALTAAYAGDDTFARSTSAVLVQQVQSATGAVTLSVSATGRDGSFAFTSTLPGAASFTLATIGGAASRTFAGLPAGTYAITAAGLPPGFAAQGFTCTTGTANGSTETFTVAAGSTVSCSYSAGFDAAAIQKATQAAIRTFLQQRAELLAGAEPDHRRMHERMTGTVFGGDDEDATASPYGKMPVDVGAFSSSGSTNLSASTSLSQLLRPMDKLPFEVWTDVRFGTFRDTPTNNGITGFTPNHYQGNSTVAFTGVDYRVMPGVLFGVLGEYDQTGQVSSTLGTAARGAGYMVGPYASVALTRNLFFDARAAFGQSTNAITPEGLLRDHFDTDRQLFRGELAGLFHVGFLEISPSVSALRFQEQQHAFTDAFGLRIGKQTVGLGQAAAGPEFAYPVAVDGTLLTPRFAVKAVYDFQRDEAAAASLGIGQPTAALRGRLEGGLDLDNLWGFGVGSSVSYDGLGDRGYSAVTGRLAVKKTFGVQPEGVFTTQ